MAFLPGAILIFTCVTGILAGPLWSPETQCATSCPVDSKFQYTPGSTYEYDYDANILTHVPGATEDTSRLRIRALARVEVISQCEFALTISDSSLEDARGKVEKSYEFSQAVEGRSLRFGYVNGVVENICPQSAAEETWVLNIKRGILSSLQNSMDSLDTDVSTEEVDISGKCPVKYTVTRGGVSKVKNILACSEDHSHETVFHGIPYNTDSDLQNLPLLKSHHECKQQIGRGIISQTTCTEKHVFRPFSRENSGATTEVTSVLTFSKKVTGVRTEQGSIIEKQTLAFDFTPSEAERQRTMTEAQATMAELCRLSHEDIRPEVPNLFTKMVRDMRKMSRSELTTFHTQSGSACSKAEKFFRDAIPMVGSAAAMDFIVDMVVKRKEVTGVEAEVWLTSQAFVARPTREMIVSAAELLDAPADLKRKSTLAVSSLVNNYCKVKADCENSDEVRNIMAKLQAGLNYNCNGDHDQVILMLKAIGNAGHAASLAQTLDRCITNAELPMETRVVAATAYRRLSCSVDRSGLLNVFSDKSLDAELRINAYLQVMVCPSAASIDQVKNILESEEINQVGSFVWTHLTNLMETSSPHKQEVVKILQDEQLKKTFDMDKRKFSRNVEWSLFSHLLNSGAAVESNIIFSEKSFVPRSGMLNLTVDVFGHSMNLFELGARMEGMERILEDLFAHKKSENPGEQVQKFDSSFATGAQATPKAQYYLKVFGNELRYEDFHDIDLAALKEKLNFLNWIIDLANEHDIEVTKSMSFLDSTMTVPTSAGLPLRLCADGTFSLNLKVKGKMDMRKSVDIEGTVSPSGAVEITSEMRVDAMVAHTGLTMRATMHSSTILQGKVKQADGKFTMDIDMPRDKMEIFDLKTRFFIEDREQQMLTDNVVSGSRCLDMSKVLGMKVCSEYSLPLSMNLNGPMFPLTGPTTISLAVEKVDTHTGYHMEAMYEQEKERVDGEKQVKDVARFAVGTPGSRISRDISADFQLNRNTFEVQLDLKSPWKTVSFATNTKNLPNKKSFNALLNADGKEMASGTLELENEQKPNGISYKPSLTVTVLGRPSTKVVADVFVNPGRKIDWTVRMRNLPGFNDPVKSQGEIVTIDNNNRWKREVDLQLSAGDFKGNVNGYIDNEYKNSIASRLDLSYAYKSAKEKVTINSKIKDESTNTITQYSMDGQWVTSMFKKYDGDFKTSFSKGRSNVGIVFDGGFDETNRVKVTEDLQWSLRGQNNKISALARVELPAQKTNYEVKAEHAHSNNDLKSEVTWDMGFHNGNFLADLKRESSSPFKGTGKVALTYPGRDMSLTQTIDEQTPGEFRSDTDLQLDSNTHLVAKAIYKMNPRHEVSGSVKYANNQPVQFLAYVKPEIRDVQTHAEITWEGRKYSVGGNAKTSGDLSDFTTSSDFDLQWPARHVMAEASINSQGQIHDVKMTTKWDADRDSSKVASFHVKLTRSAQMPALFVRADCKTAYFIELDTNARHETGSWWSEVNDFQGVAKWKSSFQDWEQMVIKFKHDLKENGFKTHMEGTKNRQKLSGDLLVQMVDWNNVQATLTMQTPVNGLRNIEASTSYKLRARGFDADGKVVYDGQTISMVFGSQLNIKKHILKGDLDVKTPFRGFEEITVFVNHNDDGQEFHTGFGGSFGNGRSLSYQQDITWIPMKMVNGKAKFLSPFSGLEKIVFSTENELKDKQYTGKHELSLQDNTWALDTSLYYEFPQLKSTIKFTLPRGHSRTLNLSHMKNGLAWETRGDLEYGRGQMKKIAIVNTIEWMKLKKWFFSVDCDACPYIKTTSMLMELEGQWENFHGLVELTNTANLADKITLTVGGAIPNWKNVEVTANYKSPVGVRDATFEGTHKKQGRQFVTNLSLNVLGKTMKLNNDMTLKDTLNFNTDTSVEYDNKKMEVSTKLKVAGDVDASVTITAGNDKLEGKVSFEGRPTDFHTTAQVSYNRDAYTGELTFAPWNVDFKFASPYATGEVTHKGPWNNFLTTAELTESGHIYKGDVTFKVGNYEMELIENFDIPSYKSQLKITHKGPLSDFETKLNFNLNGQRLEEEVTFNLAQMTGTAKMSQTFTRRWRDVEVSFGHSGQLRNFNNNGMLKIEGNVWRIDNTFSWDQRQLALATTVGMPEGQSTLNFKQTGKLTNWQCEGDVSLLGRPGTLKINFDLGGKDLSTSAAITTPFRTVRSAGFNFKGTVNSKTNFEYESDFEFNSQKYESSSEFKLYGNTLVSLTKFVTPRTKYAFNVRHDGSVDNFKTTLALFNSYGRMKSTTTFAVTDKIEGSTILETPFSGYESTSVTFTQSGSGGQFEAELRGEGSAFGGRVPTVWKATYDLSRPRQGVNGEVMLTSDFPMIRKIGAKANFKGQYDNFDASSEITYMDDTASAEVKLDLRSQITMSADVKTFCDKLRNFGASIDLTPRLPFTGTGKVYWNTNSAIETTATFSMQNKRNIEGSWTVTTPFQGYRTMTATIKHEGPRKNFETDLKLGWESKEIGTHLTFNMRDDIALGLEITTPFRNFERMGMSGKFSSDMQTRWNTEGKVYWNDEISFTHEQTLTVAGNKYTAAGSLDVATPFVSLPKFGYTYNSDMSRAEETQSLNFNGKVFWSEEISVTYSQQNAMTGEKSTGSQKFDMTLPFQSCPKFGYSTEFSIELASEKIKALSFERTVYWGSETSYTMKGNMERNAEHVEGAASLTVYGMDDMGLKFTHDGSLANMKTTGEIYWTRTSAIKGDLEFSLASPVKGSFELTTPFDSVKNLKMAFSHQGPLENFKNDAQFWFNGQESSINNEFNLDGRNFKVSSEIKTPVSGFREFALKYDHTHPRPREFKCDASVTLEGTPFIWALDYNFRSELKLTAELTTPFYYLKTMKLDLGHSAKKLTNFESSATLNLNDKEYKGDAKFKLTGNNLFLDVDVVIPNYQKFSVNMKHDGQLRNFKNGLNLFIGDGKKIRMASEFNLEGAGSSIEGKVEMNVPQCIGSNVFTLSHKMPSLKDVSSEVKLVGDKIGSYATVLAHKGNWNELDTTLTINTPYKSGTVTLTNNVQPQSWTTEVKTECDGKKWEGSFTHTGAANDFVTVLTVNSPYRSANANLKHKGHLLDFATNFDMMCDGKKWGGEISFKKDDYSVVGKTELQTTRYGNFGATMNVMKAREGWSVGLTSETPFQGFRTNSFTLKEMDSMNVYSLTSQVKLGLDVYGASWTKEVSQRAYTWKVGVNTPFRNFEKMSGELSVGRGQQVSVTANIETSYPKFETLSATVAHSGSPSEFASSAEVTTSHPSARKSSLTLSWKKNSGNLMNGNFILKTPFQSLKMVKGDVFMSKTGSSLEFKQTLDTSIRGLEHFEVNAKGSFNRGGVSGELSLKTPFDGFEEWRAEMKHSGDLKSFDTNALIVTPLSGMESTNLKLNHRGDLAEFSSGAEYNGRQFDIQGSITLKSVRVSVKTPFNKLSSVDLSASHEDMRSGSVDFTLNGIQRLDLDFSLNQSPMELTLNVRQPRPFKTVINLVKQGNMLSADAQVDWRSQKIDMKFSMLNEGTRYANKKEFSFKSTLPSGRPVEFTTTFNNDGDKITHTLKTQWDRGQKNKASYNVELNKATSRSQTMFDGKATIKTPWFTQEASVSHTMSPGRQYTTQVVVDGQNRLVISNEFTVTRPTYKNTFTIQHPQLSRDISVVAQATVDKPNYHLEGSLQANMESEEFSVSGKVQDESRGQGTRYVTFFKANHPSTVLDISFDGSLTRTAEKFESTAELKYMTSKDRQLKINSLKTEIDHVRKSINVQLATPVRTAKFVGEPTVKDRVNGIYRYTVKAGCEQNEFTAEAGYNWKDKEIDATVGHNGVSATAFAKYENIKSMVFRMSHRRTGQNDVEDVILALSPRGDRVVNTRTYRRPSAWNELQGYLNREMSSDYLTEPFTGLSSTMKEDIRYKIYYFKEKTIPVFTKVSTTLFGEEATAALGKAINIGADYVVAAGEKVGTVCYTGAAFVISTGDSFFEYLLRIVINIMDPIVGTAQKTFDAAMQIPVYMHDKVVSMVDAVQQHPLVQKITAFAPTEYYQQLKQTGRQYRRSLQDMANQYSSYMAVASDVWQNVGRRTEVRSMADYLKQAHQYAQWAYDHYEVEDTVKGLARKASEYTYDNVKDRVTRSVSGMFEDSNVNEWNPEGGNIDVDIAMPTRIPTVEMPDVDLKKYGVIMMEWLAAIQRTMSKDRYTFMDLVYSYKPTSDLYNIVPPFKSRASISGNQGYMTFDKTFYPFAGDCSYLLARDFIDGEFSVVVNYENTQGRSVRKSLTVFNARSQMEIFPDGTVTVDGKQEECPIERGNLTVIREGQLLKLNSGKGFKLECNLANDHCTVLVSGWYFSKTGGLFGTYDNEPANDMMSPTREVKQNVGEFAASWATGRRCRPVNNALEQTAFAGSPTYDICASYFVDPSSPLRAGFKVVDPESYMVMCMNDMPLRRQQVKDACKTISLYITQCKEEGIHITPPMACIMCQKPDGTLFREGETVKLTGDQVPQSADVVFVVEQSQCNTEVSRKLADIASSLKNAMARKGLTNHRFGVVGFGGMESQMEPHTHTLKGKLMANLRDFQSGLASLKFMAGPHQGDAMAAVKFASSYPFRTGVSKTLVLVTCSTCERKEVGYAEIVSLLEDRDIKLHVLMDHEFQLTSESKRAQTSYLYGHDESGIFTYKNTKDNLESDREIFSHVIRPKDICAAAAIRSKGAVFSSNQLTTARPANQNRFLNVMTNVWAAGARPSANQECSCVVDESNSGKSACKDSDRPNFFMKIFNYGTSSPASSTDTQLQIDPVPTRDRRLERRPRQLE